MKILSETKEILRKLEHLIDSHCLLYEKDNPIEKGYILGKTLLFEFEKDVLILTYNDITLKIPLNEDFSKNERIKNLYSEKRKIDERKCILNILVNSFHRNKTELLRLAEIFNIQINLEELEKQHQQNIKEKNKIYKTLDSLEKELEELRQI